MIKTLYPSFLHWSLEGSVFLISDTHFDDPDREFMGYNFSEEDQIKVLKKTCHKNDTLVHLGDVGNPEYLKELKCHKVLIMGNHDQSISKMGKYFEEVYAGPIWIAEKLVLSHEPLHISFGSDFPICFNIHGHDHSGEFYNDDYHLNIAPNVFSYLPLNLKNFISTGVLKNIESIHRATINKRVEYNGIRL